MRRRELITLLGSAAVTWPLMARAQQTERIRTVGILLGSTDNVRFWHKADIAQLSSNVRFWE